MKSEVNKEVNKEVNNEQHTRETTQQSQPHESTAIPITQQSIEKGETPSVPLTRTSEEKIEPIQYVQHIQKRAPTSQRMMIVACESRVEG